MKAKLNKVDNGYVLLVDNIMYATDNDRLSKQNCDEIFGVVEVERLAEQIVTSHSDFKTEGFSDYQNGKLNGIIEGFNKAMELNKDKKFNEKNMIMFGLFCRNNHISECLSVTDELFPKYQSLQPTEIDVEIEMECKIGCDNFIFNGDKSICCGNKIKKLDLNGNLILRKL
jgi:hypothetical protein